MSRVHPAASGLGISYRCRGGYTARVERIVRGEAISLPWRVAVLH